MKSRSTIIWIPLMSLTLLFSLLYLWFALFPGPLRPEAVQLFGMEQIQQGREYSKGLRISYILNFILQVLLLMGLLVSGVGSRIAQTCQQWTRERKWLAFLAFYVVLWLLLTLIRLPFTFFSGFYWQRLWGFSTQIFSSWWVDFLKESLLDLALGGVGAWLLFLALRLWPRTWWLICGILFSMWLIIQSLLWPVLVAPIFNNFQPITAPEITTMVDELASKADLAVNEMLVMDASKRTTKANAYFAGVGETKRIVLYDNLINQYSKAEVKAVIAHEMAHWQKGHIARGLSLGVLGSFLVWGGAYLVLRREVSRPQVSPQVWAVFLLFILLVNFVSAPLQNSISRQMEIEADQTAVLLTEEPRGAIQLQMNLALKNRSDLSPPRYIEWFSYTHPSVLTRIEKIEEVAK